MVLFLYMFFLMSVIGLNLSFFWRVVVVGKVILRVWVEGDVKVGFVWEEKGGGKFVKGFGKGRFCGLFVVFVVCWVGFVMRIFCMRKVIVGWWVWGGVVGGEVMRLSWVWIEYEEVMMEKKRRRKEVVIMERENLVEYMI